MYGFVLSPIDPEKLINSISERVTANIFKAVRKEQSPADQQQQHLAIQAEIEILKNRVPSNSQEDSECYFRADWSRKFACSSPIEMQESQLIESPYLEIGSNTNSLGKEMADSVMRQESVHSLALFSWEGFDCGKDFVLRAIIHQIEIGEGVTIGELKKKYSEKHLFKIALRHVTATKKAICSALDIPVEGACRYKRYLEKQGLLVQSEGKHVCPITKHPAHLLSTNLLEFEQLNKSNAVQLKLF
ncbi:MAG: hypothetical protein KBH01_00725 [Breznakibacter sp.]|nr:hypothetical protein [Breznakibacter sp.]